MFSDSSGRLYEWRAYIDSKCSDRSQGDDFRLI